MTEHTVVLKRRGRPTLGINALNRSLTIKISDQQLSDWTIRADKLGVSLSRFIRNATNFFCLMEKWDGEEKKEP